MNTKLIGLFLIIPILAIGGIYFGFLKTGNKNLFGRISLLRSSNNDFQNVGEVALSPEAGVLQTESVAEEKKAAATRPLPKKISKKQAANKTQIQLFSTSAPISQNVQSNIQTESVQPTSTIQITETIQPAQAIQTATTTEPGAITEPGIAAPAPASTPVPAIQAINRLLISEVLIGIEGNSDYEFIELYNAGSNSIDLTGWSIKKKSSTGNESTLVSSSRLEGKIIPANKYFLLANEGGYGLTSSPQPDVFWPKSYTLAYSNNAVILYDSNGEKIEEISWQEIQKGQSIERVSWGSSEFRAQTNPNPQNSQSN